MLNVSYQTANLLDVCTRIEEAQAQLGPQPAAELHQLLADAEAFRNVDELLNFRDGEVVAEGILSFPFGKDHRAEFKALSENPPRLDDGEIAWAKVRRIMLTGISS